MILFGRLAIVPVIFCAMVTISSLAQDSTVSPDFQAVTDNALATVAERADSGDPAAAMILSRSLLVQDASPDDWARGIAYLEQAAAGGIVEAQMRLGIALQNGQFGAARDVPRALEMFEAAAAKGDMVSIRSLGALLLSGLVPVDAERGVELLETAVAAGNVDAANLLANHYMRGQRIPQDTDRALELYQFGVATGHNGAIIGLADLYRTGPAPDVEWAAVLFDHLAASGNVTASLRIADMMVKGEGMEVDFDGGVALLATLAERTPSALVTIGDYYQRGTGTSADAAVAADYFTQAAEAGDLNGRVRLALLQRSGGPGFPADPNAALVNFKLASDAGHVSSTRIAAEMTARGEGTTADIAAAVAMFEKAAAQGDAVALTMVGDIYSRGEVTRWDAAKALEYYGRAADIGQLAGLTRAAEIYRTGLPGFSPDPSMAIELYQSAIDRGDVSAKRLLGNMLVNGAAGLRPDVGRGVTLLEESSEAEDPVAGLLLGNLFSSGRSVDADYDRAMAAFDQAIAAGNRGARVRKGIVLLSGPLATSHAEEGVEILKAAADDGVPGAAMQLARAQIVGQAPGASVEEGVEALTELVAADDIGAIRYLIQVRRDGVANRLDADLDAAAALVSEKSSVLGQEIATLEAMFVRLKQDSTPAVFAEVKEALERLGTNNANTLALRLFDTSQNGYVYLMQSELAERGLFDGPLNGTLNQSTIDALNDFCAAEGIAEECSKGPLHRGVALTILKTMLVPS